MALGKLEREEATAMVQKLWWLGPSCDHGAEGKGTVS